MPRFAANLSFLYQEYGFLDRFEAAAQDGFTAVEFLFPYAWEPQELADRLRQHGLLQALFNAPPAGLDSTAMAAASDMGKRGTACLPGREAEFRAGIEKALEKGGNKRVTIKKFDSLNHLFQKCTTCTVMEYGELETTIEPEVLTFLLEWLRMEKI